MWIGGAAIMFVMIMVTFFQWTRETRPSASMGWLESARRVSLARPDRRGQPGWGRERPGARARDQRRVQERQR